MPLLVALLRGINVGEAKRVAMADLRALLGRLGYTKLRNSGNAVFDGPAEPAAEHADRIRAALVDELGVDALVVIKTAEEIRGIVDENPFVAIATDPARLLVAMTTDSKSLIALRAPATAEPSAEEVHVGRYAAWVWCPDGVLPSKAAAALLRRRSDSGTTRNLATVLKIHAMLTG